MQHSQNVTGSATWTWSEDKQHARRQCVLAPTKCERKGHVRGRACADLLPGRRPGQARPLRHDAGLSLSALRRSAPARGRRGSRSASVKDSHGHK